MCLFPHYSIFARTPKCPGLYPWGYTYSRLGITMLRGILTILLCYCSQTATTPFLQALWSHLSVNFYVSMIASSWFYIPAPCCFNTLSCLGIFMWVGVYLPCGSNILRKMGKPHHKSIFHGTVIHFAASEETGWGESRVSHCIILVCIKIVYCNLPLHKTSFYSPIKYKNLYIATKQW